MSTSVLRIDERGIELRKPVRLDNGFLRVDGIVARAGVYEYRREDGTIRRELRPPEEVGHPDSLASYDDAPLTVGHPRRADGALEEVTASNVDKYGVGNVRGAAQFDGEFAAASMTVKAKRAIQRVDNGEQELSPGYRIELEEKSGVHPKYGRYDAIQRRVRVNHVAIVDKARGGSAIRLRMDSADLVVRGDGEGKLTSIERGHQHLIDCHPAPSPWGSSSYNSGSTSYAVSDGDEGHGHSHDWVRNNDGTITIAMSEGHTHTIPVESPAGAPGFQSTSGAGAEGQFDQYGTRLDHHHMADQSQTAAKPPPDAVEQIRLLTVRADEADRGITEQRTRADVAERAAEGLRADLVTARERVSTLEAQIAAGTTAVENAAVLEQRTRADVAERELSDFKAKVPAMINKRASLMAKASATLGPKFRGDSLTDREILIAGVRHLRPKEQISADVTTEYLERRFDSLIEDRTNYGASLARASDVLAVRRTDSAPTGEVRADQLPWADQWKAGLGEFATSRKGS